MLSKNHGACYLEASIPSSLGRRLESVRELYPYLSDSEFFIVLLGHGLDWLDHSSGGDE